MHDRTKIIALMTALRRRYPVLSHNKGMGYCAYGSKLLSMDMTTHQLKGQILVGRRFAGTVHGSLARKAAQAVVMDIVETTDPKDASANLKRAFIKRGHRLLEDTGHAVVLVAQTVYDITAGQFGNPDVYSLSKFNATWAASYVAEIDIDAAAEFGVIKITPLKKAFAAKW